MNAPDKIYLEKEREINKISHLSGVSPVVHSGYEHIAYIRKDALLEWAKTKLSHIQEDFDVYTGQRLILRELIEKIESL